MKNLKTLLFVLTIAITSTFANASIQPNQDKTSLEFSISAYLNMINNGNSADYANILSDDVKFNTTRNGKIITHGKSEELKFMKMVGNVKQNCKTEHEILKSDENFCLVKVRMIYEGFTKENFISFAKTANGWQITDVTSTFGA